MTKRGPDPDLVLLDEAATFASGDTFSITWSAGDGTMTTSRSISGMTVHDIQETAKESVDAFAESMRRVSSTAYEVSGKFTVLAEDVVRAFDVPGDLVFGFDPAKPAGSDEWVDSIDPLPDISGNV